MKFILTSSGIDENVYRALGNLLNDKSDISVGFITSSAKYESNPSALTERLQGISDTLLSLGFRKADGYYLPKYSEEYLLNALRGYDVIYIFGGNAFNLLSVARRVGFEQVLDQLKSEKIIVGQSSGSYILCPNIEMATWKGTNSNDVGIKDLSGFNYVPFLVTAHYSDEVSATVKEGVNKSGIKTFALEDGQAIVVNNENISFIGNPIILN